MTTNYNSRTHEKDILCPRCGRSIPVYTGIKLLSCFNCGLRFEVNQPGKIRQFFETLIYRVKALIPDWLISNWSRFTTVIESKVVFRTVVYQSHCWYCAEPIRSIKTESRFTTWIGAKWFGNQKCPKLGCQYFLCIKCGRCLCDRSDVKLGKPPYFLEEQWLLSHPKNDAPA